MAGFDEKEVLEEMLAAAKASIGDSLPETLNYVKEELKKLAKEIAKVETSRLIGEIDKKTARLLTNSLINAAKTVKAAGEGVVKVQAEQAIMRPWRCWQKPLKQWRRRGSD